MIRSIVERTGCRVDIEDDGTVNIASSDESAAAKAMEIIREITAEAELGKTYLGKVVRLTNFGAFVEILPNMDGLLHISEVAHYRVNEIQDEMSEGDEVMVKVIEIDGQGRVRLSRKALLPKEEQGSESGGNSSSDGGRGQGRGRRREAPRR